MANRSGEWNGVELAGGRYLVTARLGVGGMGAVYRAVDRNLDADVVIKVPHRVMLEDPDFAGRFTREIRSLVKLSHPRIVKVTDVGEWDGSPFAVMQFLPGGSLEDRQQYSPSKGTSPCDPKEVPKWLIGIAQALDYVHSQGYIHRDVKPGNILFDAQGHSFLSDFGVAKVLSESSEAPSSRSVTGAGKVLGTPEYMAPELIMGEKVDGRVDQYALAVTVYELLCGRRPFEGEGDVKTRVLVLHTTTPPPSLLQWQPALSSRLSEAVLKGLAKDPAARYPSCTALAAAVVAAVKEAPTRQPEQVRIQCPACGKFLGVSQADLIRIQQAGGRRVACPACQQPVAIGTSAAGQRSGTMIVPNTTSAGPPTPPPAGQRSGTMIVPGSGAVVPPLPDTQRSGTMIVPGAGSPAAPASRSGTMIVGNPNDAPATPTRGTAAERSGTMIVASPAAAPGTPAGRSGTMIVGSPEPEEVYSLLEENEPDRPIAVPVAPPQPPAQSIAADVESSPLPYVWIAVGAAGSILAIVFVAILALMPGRRAQPAVATGPSPAPAAVDPSVAAREFEKAFAKAFAPPPAGPSAAKPSAEADALRPTTPKAPPPAASPTPVATVSPKPPPLATTPAPGMARLLPSNSPAPPRFAGFPPGPPSTVQPGLGTVVTPPAANNADVASKVEPLDELWTPQIASRKPARSRETLEKIVANAAQFQNQLIVPDGMYCLEERAQRLPNGRLLIGVSQSQIVLSGSSTPNVRTAQPIDIEIEPKLVDVLQRASQTQPDHLRINPAIVTLLGTERGTLRLVKAEFLILFRPRYNPNGIPDVDYFTLAASPDGSTENKANDDEWETLPRMLHIKNVCERQLRAWKTMKSSIKQSAIDRQMNSMFSSMMRSAVIQNARDERMLEQMRGVR